MNYVKKFLALSFMSATAAFLMSCNSNILGIVQKVDVSSYSDISADDEASLKKVKSDFDKKTDNVYKDKSDSKNSVLYVETGTISDEDKRKAGTAVVKQDGATVKAAIGAPSKGGSPSLTVNKIGATSDVKNLTLDSWDEKTKIEAAGTLKPDELKVVNLSADASKKASNFTGNLPFAPDKSVYDSKNGILLASTSQKSPFAVDLSKGNLYASTKDNWAEIIKVVVNNTALNTGTLDMTAGGSKVDPQQKTMSVSEATNVQITYKPKNEDETYFSTVTDQQVILYPLSQFGSQVDKLTNNADAADTITACKNKLDNCVAEYKKLTSTAKTASEVEYTVDKKTKTCTPKDWLGSLATQYVLAASVKDLYEAKNGAMTEDAILDAIAANKLSSEDKQYLLSMIQKNYDDLDNLYSKEVKDAASTSVADLKKQIQDGSSSGGSSKGSGSSSGSSSKSGSSSGKSGSSSSIKTGSDSLFVLFSSLGLSSGTLLSLRKRKGD